MTRCGTSPALSERAGRTKHGQSTARPQQWVLGEEADWPKAVLPMLGKKVSYLAADPTSTQNEGGMRHEAAGPGLMYQAVEPRSTNHHSDGEEGRTPEHLADIQVRCQR